MAKWGEVLRVTEVFKPDPVEGVLKFYRYDIKTAKGARITVDVPEDRNRKDLVEPILQEKAMTQDAILSL